MIKKITLIIQLMVLAVFTANAQVDTVWTKTLGGTGNESVSLLDVEWSAPSIGSDAAGNLYVLGRSNTVSGDVHQSLGGEDCWIIKLNSNGDTLWTKVFGGTNGDVPTDILVLDNGGFFITGFTYSNDIDFSGHHAPNVDEDGFIARFDTDGNVIWSKLYGGGSFATVPGHDIINSMTLLSNGDLLAVGKTNSNTGDLPIDFTKFGAAWILRVDTANGNLINTKKVVGPNHDEYTPNLLISVSELEDGTGYFALGETRYGIQPYRMWLVKFDNSDNVVWNKEFGSLLDNSAKAVIAMPNGGAMIAGHITNASGDVSSWFGGFTDSWIAIIDSNQNVTREVTFGGSQGAEVLKRIKKVANNSYVFTASALSTDNYLHQNLGAADFWLVSVDQNLDTNWTMSFGGSGGDALTGLTADNNGNIYVVGKTESNDFYVHNNHGGRDLFLAKIQNAFTVGLKNVTSNNNIVSIYPNPAQNNFSIVVNNAGNENVEISIFNSLGQNVKNIIPLKGTVFTKKVDVNHFSKGIYFVTVKVGTHLETKKLIIER